MTDPIAAIKPLADRRWLPELYRSQSAPIVANKSRGTATLLGTFSAADLQRREFPPVKWIVPDILPEGLTLLAGKPKLGKSWLALDIALAVASGGSVLGRGCEAGPVLYLALEDNPRRLQRRLSLVAGSAPWPGDLEFQTDWPRLDAGLSKMRQWLAARPGARLLIVDTLATVRPLGRISEGAHSNDYAALRGLHQLASEAGIAILVVHHVRKAEADDPFDTVSGSTGLTGAADATLILSRKEGGEGVILYGRGRDLEEFETGVEFDDDTCRWRDLGSPAEAFASDTRQAILAAVRAGNTTPGEIERETGIDGANIRQTLRRMALAGDLKKDGRGLYSIPSDPLSHQSHCHKGKGESDNVTVVTPACSSSGTDLEAFNPDAW